VVFFNAHLLHRGHQLQRGGLDLLGGHARDDSPAAAVQSPGRRLESATWCVLGWVGLVGLGWVGLGKRVGERVSETGA
jgi:hypothetical protein